MSKITKGPKYLHTNLQAIISQADIQQGQITTDPPYVTYSKIPLNSMFEVFKYIV